MSTLQFKDLKTLSESILSRTLPFTKLKNDHLKNDSVDINGTLFYSFLQHLKVFFLFCFLSKKSFKKS